MNATSFGKFHKKEILEICQEANTLIKRMREEEKDHHIKLEMKRKKFIYFGRTKTYKESKEYLDKLGIEHDYYWITFKNVEYELLFNKLISTCLLMPKDEDVLYLSIDDASDLLIWKNKINYGVYQDE